MRGKFATVLVLCIICLASFTVPALAERPHNRDGFFIGFGLGGGSAHWKGADDRSVGGVGNFRIGYAVSPNLTFGLESCSWVKRESAGAAGGLTLIYNVSTFGATYFPWNSGAYIKGGMGYSTASFEDVGFLPGLGENKFQIDQTGFGILAAAGYEWRLTRKFAIGPEIDVVYLRLGDPFHDANYASVTLMMDWYW